MAGRPSGTTGTPLTEGLDPAETELLRKMFLDEAQEQLETVAHLLAALATAPTRREGIDELLRLTHTLKGSAATLGLGEVGRASHALEEVFVEARAGRMTLSAEALETLISATDTLRSLVEAMDQPGETAELALRFDAELLAVASPGHPAAAAPDAGDPSSDDRRLAPDRRRDELQLLRVDVDRVDGLMDGVGELVFDRTRIERRIQEVRNHARDLSRTRGALRALLGPLRAVGSAEAAQALAERVALLEADLAERVADLTRATATLVEDAEALRRTTSTIQDGITQLRMLSVRWLFQRVARPLRDAARGAGKRIELSTVGEETELDRSLVEQITDPLVQLLRNAVAHGIEPAGERMARGKPAVGRVTLSARHQGDSVFLEVADDGGGIDVAALRQLLVTTGRLGAAEAAACADDRVTAAIFEPGVSTREATDELAGRGVGLDVVRERIARLGGEIAVASVAGEGTRFTIRLPLTTALAQALLFKVGGQVYALPQLHVVETSSVEVPPSGLPPHLPVRDELVPLLSLHELLGLDPPDGERLPAVVVEFAGRRLAVTCDRIVGAREIVVKSLGPLLAPLGLYAGATISGTGKVQLILDPAALAQVAYRTRATPPGPETGVEPAPAPHWRVLVTDDSRPVRETVSRFLSAAGYVVDTASDGWEAWEMLQEVAYDALVTDLEMPRVGGLELVQKLRRAGQVRLAIVVISSRSADDNRERVEAAGADAFLAKPVPREILLDQLAALLAR